MIMVWTKLSDDFGDECAKQGLSDAAFRTHVEGLLWTMRRETDGRIPEKDLKRFAESDQAADGLVEVLEKGLWRTTSDGYEIVHHMEHQTTSDVLRKRREANSVRQQRRRRKAVGLPDEEVMSRRDDTRDQLRDDTRDQVRDDTRDSGLDGTGLGWTGKAHLREGIELCFDCGVDPCACSQICQSTNPRIWEET